MCGKDNKRSDRSTRVLPWLNSLSLDMGHTSCGIIYCWRYPLLILATFPFIEVKPVWYSRSGIELNFNRWCYLWIKIKSWTAVLTYTPPPPPSPPRLSLFLCSAVVTVTCTYLLWRPLAGVLSDTTYSDEEYPQICSGHKSTSTKAWLAGFSFLDETVEAQGLTNSELSDILNPTSDEYRDYINYVYDSMTYPWCEDSDSWFSSSWFPSLQSRDSLWIL